MAKLHTIEKVVLEVLEKDPRARKDDYVLIELVYEKFNPEILNFPFWVVMMNRKKHKLPSWETITRARRKIQEKHPELKDAETAKIRANEEKEYIEYAIS